MTSKKYQSRDKTRFSILTKRDIQDLTVSFNSVIRTLQVLGNCPLHIKPIRDSSNVIIKYEYSFKFLSFPVLHTATGFLAYSVYIWYILIFQVFEGDFTHYVDKLKGPQENFPPGTKWAISCFIFIYFMWLWLNPSLLVLRCDSVAQFLNSIAIFSRQFADTFSGEKASFLQAKSSIRFLFFGNTIVTFILFTGICHIYFPCATNFISSRFKFQCYHDGLLNPVVSLIAILGGTVYNFQQDTLMISLFRIIENMLLEVKTEMEGYGSNWLVDTKTIQNWMKMRGVLKRQANILNHIVGPHELATLLMNFLTWVLLAFMAVNLSAFSTAVVIPLTFFCVSNLVRLNTKTSSVTRITGLEKEIRDLIIKLETDTYSSYAECERAFLVNIMTCRPIRFTLCNLITLDARLTTWLIGGVVTYLIVLLQFQDLMNSDKK